MKRDEIRQRLIEGTIRVIAEEGLEKATTKQIGLITDINEAYIYRCFDGKDDMLAKTFAYLDDELVSEAMQHVPVMYRKELKFELRCRMFFTAIWKIMLGNKEKCLTYMRYYYSPHFCQSSAQEHKKRFKPLVEIFSEALKSDADVWMILNHILNVMFDFALKVHNDQMPNNDDYAEHVFRVIYASIMQYFKGMQEQIFEFGMH